VFVLATGAEKEKRRKNLKISNMLAAAAAFKMNPNDHGDIESCSICLEDFKPDEDVISLP
jgi:hypothetical protein